MGVIESVLLASALFFIASIVWTTFRVGISPMPSSNKARKAMLALVAQAGDGAIYELGSGWGNLLIPLAKQYPKREIVGFELSLLPWLFSVLVAKVHGLNNIKVYRQDFLQADLRFAAVIVCYLYPKGMAQLSYKLESEAGRLNYLVSNNFAMPGLTPESTIKVDDLYQSPVYLYRIP